MNFCSLLDLYPILYITCLAICVGARLLVSGEVRQEPCRRNMR